MKRFIILKERCQACGRCAMMCFRGAISLDSGVARIDASKCSGCGLCLTVCTQEAIITSDTEPVPVAKLAETVAGLRSRTEEIIDSIEKFKR